MGVLGLLLVAATCRPFIRFVRVLLLVSVVNMVSIAGRTVLLFVILALLLNGVHEGHTRTRRSTSSGTYSKFINAATIRLLRTIAQT